MCWIQGANTRIPHRPQTTDGTTASRSITYTIGRDHRYGTTSVSSRAMPTLTGTAMMIAIADVIGRGIPGRPEDPQPLGLEPQRGLLGGREGDQDEDHQHQQPGSQRDDLEGAVTERPPLGQGVGGSGHSGRTRLLRHGAHGDDPFWSVCVTVLTATPLLARLSGRPHVPILLSCALAC